jgi:hypothetical protein
MPYAPVEIGKGEVREWVTDLGQIAHVNAGPIG